MLRTAVFSLCTILAAIPLTSAVAADPVPFELHDGDRVVLLGGTFFERMQAHGHLETLLTARCVDRQIKFRNLGWSGDTAGGISRAVFGTPADGFERLKKDVAEAEPTVVLVNYGANEAHAGAGGLAEFQAQLNVLLDFLESTGARVALLSPHPYWRLGEPFPDPDQYNSDLALYCGALRETAARRGLAYIDIQDIASQLPVRGGEQPAITENGVHLTGYGYWLAAPLLSARLGAKEIEPWRIDVDYNNLSYDATATSVASIEKNEAGLKITAAARQLAIAETPNEFGLPPQPVATAGTIAVRGLPTGVYRLDIDGAPVFWADAEQFARGLPLPFDVDDEQTEAMRRAIVDKNELYFHRYRPQNETYLFLFRKHEQGNNAVEIPQFEPLVEEKEKEIARLKRPAQHVYELVRDDL